MAASPFAGGSHARPGALGDFKALQALSADVPGSYDEQRGAQRVPAGTGVPTGTGVPPCTGVPTSTGADVRKGGLASTVC